MLYFQITEDSVLRCKAGTLCLVIPVHFIYYYCLYPLYLLIALSIYFQNYIVSFSMGRNECLVPGGFHFLSMRHMH